MATELGLSTASLSFRDFKRVIGCLSFCAVLAASLAQAEDSAAVSFFKSFLEKRPPVEEAVFQTERVLDPAKEPNAQTNPPSYYLARWASYDNFYDYGSRNLSDLTNGVTTNFSSFGVLSGQKHGVKWQINGLFLKYFGTNDPRRAPLHEQTLNFGIPDLKPNTLQWTGNHFEARNLHDQRITGLLRIEDQLPKELGFQVDGWPWSNVVTYHYPAGRTFPESFIASVVRSNQLKPEALVLTRLFSLKVASAPFDQARLDPETFIPESKKISLLETNGQTFQKIAAGKYVLVAEKESAASNVSKVVYVTLILVAMTAFFLYFKLKGAARGS